MIETEMRIFTDKLFKQKRWSSQLQKEDLLQKAALKRALSLELARPPPVP